MKPDVCPCCGQPMMMRHGVRFTAMPLQIFDMIEKAGDRGVHLEALAGAIFPGVPSQAAFKRIRVQVHGINDLLEETNIRVRAIQRLPCIYRVITLKPRQRIPINDKPYDAADDFAKSVAFGLDHVRRRVAAGGPKGFMGG